MINILHVISDTNIGGAGTHLASLVNSLNKKQFNVFVACPKNAQIIRLINDDVTIIEVSSMQGDKSFDIGCIYELTKIIKSNDINLVHTHGSLSGRIAGKICKRKIIFTRHTSVTNYKKKNLKWILSKYFNLLLCDKVIAVSKYISNQLINSGFPENKIEIIYNGIDIKSFEENYNSNDIKNVYGITDEIILLIVARIEEIKGHKYLLKAVHGLIREDYNIKLIIVGSGSQEHQIKEIINSYSIERNVIMTGTIKDVKPITSIADIIVLPSLIEALGLALIEGMCMGKPCIASNVDGIPEVIKDGINGILVPSKDIESLKNAISQLIDNPELRVKMGQEGKKIALEKFNLEKMIEKVQNLYINVLS